MGKLFNAILIEAGVPDENGDSYTVEALESMARQWNHTVFVPADGVKRIDSVWVDGKRLMIAGELD